MYLGIVLAYFANYGCQVNIGDTTNARWLVPTSLHIMFSGIIFLLTFLQYESPRFLIKQGKDAEALDVMSRLRRLPADHPYVTDEIVQIKMQHQEEMEATRGASWYGSKYIHVRGGKDQRTTAGQPANDFLPPYSRKGVIPRPVQSVQAQSGIGRSVHVTVE